MVIIQDQDYWISLGDHLFLMHKVLRPEINSYASFCVGEAFPTEKGFWEVRIAFVSDRFEKNGQILIGIVDSLDLALEVLWEQRHLMYWGVFQ